MEEMDRKLIEKLDADFHKWSSKEGWEPCDITLMKDLQKLMYYIEVRDAMKEGTKQYPGYEYMDDDRSYRRGRNAMGQYTSGNRGYYSNCDGRSMHNMPPMNDMPWGSYDNRYYDQGSGRRYYDDMRGSGRMYRDSEKDNVLDYLHRMMDSESRPEIKTAMQNVLREIEAK